MPRITQKGQVTIPQNIRKTFSFHPGTDVQFLVRGNQVLLIKSRKENPFLKWLGSGKGRKKQKIDLLVDRVRGRIDE